MVFAVRPYIIFTGENFLVETIADQPNSIMNIFFSKMSGSVISSKDSCSK